MIRLFDGGDEFCGDSYKLSGGTELKNRCLRRAQWTVYYGPNNTVNAEADFGYSYTDGFERDKEMLEQYVNMADVAMHEIEQI